MKNLLKTIMDYIGKFTCLFLGVAINIVVWGGIIGGICVMSGCGRQQEKEPVQQAQQVDQTPVVNTQFSQSPNDSQHVILIDEQLGVVCFYGYRPFGCVSEKDIKPEGLAELRAQAKSQAAAEKAAAEKAAAEKAAAEKANTSH